MIQLNGKAAVLPEQVQTVSDLLTHYQLSPEMVIVERNEQIVDKMRYSVTPIGEGDKLELVHFVGGG